MSRFRSKGSKKLPSVSTASLPDIVFMLLFFFMAVTTLREVDVRVTVRLPEATEGKILEKKSLASFIYIGEPFEGLRSAFGAEPMIQLNDSFREISEIEDFIAAEREQLSEVDKTKMIVVLKIDREAKMGIVTDVKQALRRANALKIMYADRNVSELTSEQ